MGLMRRVEELAVDIELELRRGGVADPDRLRILVAGQPVELDFGQQAFPGNAIEDMRLLRVSGHRPQQPFSHARASSM